MPPMAKKTPGVTAELAVIERQLTLNASIRERFPPKRLMDKAEQLLDATKMIVSRETGVMAVPDNVAQLGVLKLLVDHYELPTGEGLPTGDDSVDIFRSPAVLAAAKKLINQQEAEIERLKIQNKNAIDDNANETANS